MNNGQVGIEICLLRNHGFSVSRIITGKKKMASTISQLILLLFGKSCVLADFMLFLSPAYYTPVEQDRQLGISRSMFLGRNFVCVLGRSDESGLPCILRRRHLPHDFHNLSRIGPSWVCSFFIEYSTVLKQIDLIISSLYYRKKKFMLEPPRAETVHSDSDNVVSFSVQ